MLIIRQVDALSRIRFRRDAESLAAWKSAREPAPRGVKLALTEAKGWQGDKGPLRSRLRAFISGRNASVLRRKDHNRCWSRVGSAVPHLAKVIVSPRHDRAIRALGDDMVCASSD